VGAFLLLALSYRGGRTFALLKFEDEKVLSYHYELQRGRSAKPRPTFGEIERTFVQNRNALQKAALIRLSREGDEICVVDRQNPPQRPAAYFEQFLHARRKRTEEELTKALIDMTRNIAQKHRDALPREALRNLSQRLYDASQSGGSVDGENIGRWLQSVVGPLSDDSPILRDLDANLKRAGMAGESFVLQRGAIAPPRNRRVETVSGVKVSFPAGLQDSIISVNRDRGVITIRDQIVIDDYELISTARARS